MHSIKMKTEDPIYVKQFRIPKAQCDDVQKQIEELLRY
jgi:hypothetical protein